MPVASYAVHQGENVNEAVGKQLARGKGSVQLAAATISVAKHVSYSRVSSSHRISFHSKLFSHFDEGGLLKERRVGLESYVALVGEEVDAVQRHAATSRRDQFLVCVVRPGTNKGDRRKQHRHGMFRNCSSRTNDAFVQKLEFFAGSVKLDGFGTT